MSTVTFDALAAFTVQSTAVAALAYGFERLLSPGDRKARWMLWAFAALSALLLPFSRTFSTYPAPIGDSVVFSVESFSRSAPPEARIGAVWAVAAVGLLLAVWRLCGLLRLRSYVAQAAPLPADALLAAEIAAIEERIGARADYRVSRAVEGPLVCGFRGPVVVLPTGFAEMPPEQRQAIVAHELAHVRNHDWLKLLAEEAVRCAVWFTPAVHLILRRLRVVREMFADAAALEVTQDRSSYLNTLVEIARRPIRADALVAPLFLEPRSLKQRVAALLEEHPMSRTRRVAAMMAVVVLLPLAGRWARDAFPARLRAAEGTVHKVGDGVTAPKLLTKVDPAYTDEASEAKLQGTVLLSLEVHPDGKAYNIQVKRGLGMGLDEAAVTALEQWRFEPGMKDGEPVIVAASVEMNFKVK
jgi:TonB family protein